MESSAFTALTEQIAEIAAHVRAVSGGRKEESPDRLLTTLCPTDTFMHSACNLLYTE